MDDFTALELSSVATSQLQAFNSQVVAHLRNYKPEIGRIDGQLKKLKESDGRLEAMIRGVESDVSKHHDQNVSSYTTLADRLAKLEQLFSALPAWKSDLLHRIDALSRESHARLDASASHAAGLEDTLNHHISSTRERLDMLTVVARTASEARQQQQARLDEQDIALRAARDEAERTTTAHKLHLKRLDEQHVLTSSKLAEVGGHVAGHDLELQRLHDAQQRQGTTLEGVAKQVDSLNQVSMGFSQELELVKRAASATDATCTSLVSKLAALDSDVSGRLHGLEQHRNTLFAFKDEAHVRFARIEEDKAAVQRHLKTLDGKVEAGPPGLWKLTQHVQQQEEQLAATKAALAAAQAAAEELSRRLDDAQSALSHQKDVVAQLREEGRMLSDRVSSESRRAQAYVDDRMEPLARRYELEAVKKALDAEVSRLQSALAGSGERLKFELLHDEAAQVGSLREYMGSVERLNAQLAERLRAVEAGLQAEAERGRSVGVAARQLQGQMDELLSTGHTDIARLRGSMDSLQEELDGLLRKAKKAGHLTTHQVEELLDMRLNGPIMDALLMKKLSALPQLQHLAPAAAPSPGAPRARPAAASSAPSLSRLQTSSFRGSAGPASPSRPASAATAQAGQQQQQSLGGAPTSSLTATPLSRKSFEDQLGECASPRGSPAAGPGQGGPDSPVAGGNARTQRSQSGQAGEPQVPLPDLPRCDSWGTTTGHGEGEGQGMGSGGGRGVGGAEDPAVGLRLVALEAQVVRLGDALRSMEHKAASSAEVSDLRQDMQELGATVARVQAGVGLLGEAGEVAVRRHVHATLLPEVLQRQAAEARRVTGWLDEQLAGVTLELHALRQAQGAAEGIRQATGAEAQSQAQRPGSSGEGDPAVQQLQSRLEVVAGCVGRLAESLGLEALLLPHPWGGAGAGGGSAGGAGAGSQGGRRNGRGKQAKGGQETAAACGAEDGASSGGEAAGGQAAPVASAESSAASLQEEQEQRREDEGQAGQGLKSPEGSSRSCGSVAAEQPHPVTRVDLPALLCRLDQLEAAVGAATAGQQALKAAAATAAAATGGAAVVGGGGGGGGVLGAAAVQGLVDAAVSDVQLRLRQVERELPLVARSYEVRALTRTFVHLAAAGGGGDGSTAAGGGRKRANGNAHRVAGMDAELAKRLGSLELALATMDERGRALEARWAAQEARWGGALGEVSAALPRLQAAVTQVAQDMQHRAAGAGQGQSATGAGVGARAAAGSAGSGPGGQGGGATGYVPDPVSVELAGLAHDLVHAAREELRRTRDGPLPDGTQDGVPNPAALAAREAALVRLRRKPREVAAHVELLEGAKAHLDRLLGRCAGGPVDHLVLLAAMGAMRVKLLEDATEAFREQIMAVFRSLERAFQALVGLQEAVAAKGSAAAVSQLAAVVQDVSSGLAALAAHAAVGAVTGRTVGGSTGGGGAPTSSGLPPPAAADAAVRRRPFSSVPAAYMDPGGQYGEEELAAGARSTSPPGAVRPSSPLRLAGPGVNTAQHRQQAAAARGRLLSAGPTVPSSQQAWGSRGAGAGATGGSGGAAQGASAGPSSAPATPQTAPGGLHAALPGAFVPSNGNPPPSFLAARRNLGAEADRAAAAAAAIAASVLGAVPPGSGSPLVDPGDQQGGSYGGGAQVQARTASAGPQRGWSARRPMSAVASGLHVPVGFGSPGGLGRPGSMPSPQGAAQSGLPLLTSEKKR